MAVVVMWKCDRDGSMFTDKKEADAYDKMLELAEHFTEFLKTQSTGISEAEAENIGLLLAKNKDSVMSACKGKPEALLEISDESDNQESNVTALPAKS
ncbi:hypothetical protein FT643_19815 [Ketobacter sp. MCCC 1A13808]|uniref:YebG family protein n=1 Tax=Ketobacter sp. MCCC 1A13808 TaxID=2602738 RepID=UPI0012EC731E|nr:YebG family protein [Ketobacter sp. MCCC 1A13808]MVF14388.1 hypothetical protein [Ketobacter sp. MCCC 1A13808]